MTINVYEPVEDFFQQADIFKIDIVSPIADTRKRIFRTVDGRHGSIYFEGNCKAKVFDEEDLVSSLNKIERGPDHTDPFTLTDDGNNELVIVGAKKIKYGIMASNTCDIAGKDKKPLSLATILPIIPLADVCRTESLPLGNSKCTIHNFIKTHYGDDPLKHIDEFNYMNVIRGIID